MSNSPTSGLGTGGSLANDRTADDPTSTAISQIDDLIRQMSQLAPKAAVRDANATGGLIPGLKPTSAEDVSLFYTQNIQPLLTFRNELQQSQMGFVTLPDGTVMSKGELPPEQQAALDKANAVKYAQILNQFGLDQFNVMSKATSQANDVAQSDFTNKLGTWDRMLGLDKFGFDQATKKLDRWLGIQDQATKEAQLEQDAQKLAIPYGTTNGKTDFSGADLGAGVAGLASMAGIGGNTPVIRYPGTQTMDPIGTINTRSQAMGGGGAAPTLEMPAPLATAGNMPTPPQLSAGPAAPTLQLPPQLSMPAPAPGLPAWAPNTDQRPNNGRGIVAG